VRRLYRRGALPCHDASVRPETSAGTGPGRSRASRSPPLTPAWPPMPAARS